MTDLRPTLSLPASGAHGSTPPGVRNLTADELGHLDRARTYLRGSGADLSDAQAVGALLHATRTRWAAEPGAPVPESMVMALGVGVGDLVVARVPGSRWALRTAGPAPTPAVVSLSGEDAALPLADVAARWRTGCTPTWVAEYVAAAAAHLASPAGHEVPTPRRPTPQVQDSEPREPAATATNPTPVVLPSRAPAPAPDAASAPLPARGSAPATDGGPSALPARGSAPATEGGSSPLPVRGSASAAGDLSSALPARRATAAPDGSSSALPARAPQAGESAAAAGLPSRPAAGSGPAGYFATAGGAFPTPHVVAPAPGAPSPGPGRPVHTSLASAFSRTPAAAPAPAPAPVPAPAPPTYRTPAELPQPPSPAAQDIALGVLEQALEAALASDGVPAPFGVVDGSPTHDHQPRRFDGDPARALQEARAWVRGTGGTRAAVAWFGQLSGDEGAAVFVEASDAGAPSLVVAHRYSALSYDEGRTRPARAVGGPLVLDQGVPLL
ncbi:hypothetical protein [Cellulomonas xylanilytica]|nr:hypothetical protein [Cellulomonas xylanilytica]